MSAIQRFLPLTARILLAAVFIISGSLKIPNFEMTAQFMAAKGMPMTTILLCGAIAVEILGGLSVLVGFNARIGALALALFLIPTTLIFHSFWTVEEAMARQGDFYSFFKNLSVMGGLLMVVSFGAGGMSIDAAMGRRAPAPVSP